MASAEGWLYTGKYYTSSNGAQLADDSKLKPGDIDSLHKIYMRIDPADVRKNIYIPKVEYAAKEKKGTAPYLIRTLYKVTNNVPTAVYQEKIVFSATQHNDRNDVVNISLAPADGIRKFDQKLLMTEYKKKLAEEAHEEAPPMKDIKN